MHLLSIFVLHSIRHSFKLSNELNKTSFIKGFKEFLLKLSFDYIDCNIVLNIAIFLNNYLVFDSAISKVIFIGLASLTFPHILLEYLIENMSKHKIKILLVAHVVFAWGR